MSEPRNFMDDYPLEAQTKLLRAYRLAVVLMAQDSYLFDESVREDVKSAIDEYMEMRDFYVRAINSEAPYNVDSADSI